MEEITGNHRRRAWKFNWKPLETAGEAAFDGACCGPVAVRAIEKLLDINYDTEDDFKESYPRRRAVLAMKHVLRRCHEMKWFEQEDASLG